MVDIHAITVTASNDANLERTIISNLSLKIAPGEFIVLVGNNGSGKSTLFNAISGKLPLDAGTIYLDGENVTDQGAHVRATHIAQVVQDPRIGTIESMTIEENLSFAFTRGKQRTFHYHNTSERRKLFKERLAHLGMGLEHRLDDLAGNLSGGQRQVVALVMATLAPSKVLLLDEITAALDPATANTVMRITARLVREEQRTTLMITHNMAHALEYGNRTLIMNNGTIVGTIDARHKKELTPSDLARLLTTQA